MIIDHTALRAAAEFPGKYADLIVRRDVVLSLLDEIAELRTLLQSSEQDAQDAKRYRWLRDAPATSQSEPIRNWLWSRPIEANMNHLDTSIDHAMSSAIVQEQAKEGE